MSSRIVGIYISPAKGEPMQSVIGVQALTQAGLAGDRYAMGEGSYSQGKVGIRQVTLIQNLFILNSGFSAAETRRNIIVEGDVELMWLINRGTFNIGKAIFRALKYCDPCPRPGTLAGKKDFKKAFFEHGGIVAEIVEGGEFELGNELIPPPKNYE